MGNITCHTHRISPTGTRQETRRSKTTSFSLTRSMQIIIHRSLTPGDNQRINYQLTDTGRGAFRLTGSKQTNIDSSASMDAFQRGRKDEAGDEEGAACARVAVRLYTNNTKDK